jgi:hypothetical protein
VRSLICSLMPLPRINHFLSPQLALKARRLWAGTSFAFQSFGLQWRSGE